MSFYYNIDKKKIQILAGAIGFMEFAHSSHTCVFFIGDAGFLLQPKAEHMRWIGMYISQSEWVWVCGSGPVVDGHPAQGGCPPCAPSCWGWLWPPATPNWSKQVGKQSYLFWLIFLKCMNNSHLFQCLTLEVILDLYLKVWWCFCDQKYAIRNYLLFVSISQW